MVILMEEQPIQVVREGVVSEIIINRPQSLNALNPDVLQSLVLTLEKLEKVQSIRVLTITGMGDKAFVAGADITSMAGLGPRPIADYVELGQRTMRLIEHFPVPVIAKLNGYALGGGLELALSCDLIVAAESAKLGQPEVNLGIIPGFGGTQRLIQRCGIGTARRLCYTGEIITAEEALRLGIIDQIYPTEELGTRTMKLCELIASKAPLAVREAKRVIRQSQETMLLSGLRLEVESFLKLFASVDREEGMAAFMEKREPKFKGR